jgi:beta-glucosidase
VGRTSGFSYRYGKQGVFQFGDGLSYSQFRYSATLEPPHNESACATWTIVGKVENVGNVSSEDVVQLYLRLPSGLNLTSPLSPLHDLRGFQRIGVGVHLSETVTFTLTPAGLAVAGHNLTDPYEIWPGKYSISFGGCQPTSGLPGCVPVVMDFHIDGQEPIPLSRCGIQSW